MTDDGALTEDGVALRTPVEAATDEMAAAPWDLLGETGTRPARARSASRWSRAAVAAGAFPDGVFA